MSRLLAVTISETVVLAHDAFQLKSFNYIQENAFYMVLDLRVLSLVSDQLTARHWGSDWIAMHHISQM